MKSTLSVFYYSLYIFFILRTFCAILYFRIFYTNIWRTSIVKLTKFDREGLKCFNNNNNNNNISRILFLTLRLFERCTQICYSFVEIFDVVCQYSWSNVFVSFTNFVIFQQMFSNKCSHRFSYGREQQMVKLRAKGVEWNRDTLSGRDTAGNSQSVSRSCPRRTGLNENKIKLCQVLKLRTYRRNNPIPPHPILARRERQFALLLHLHALGSITFRFMLFASFLFFLSQTESDLLWIDRFYFEQLWLVSGD